MESPVPLRDVLPAPGDLVAGYLVVRPVGEGAMGVVYEARDRSDAPVALKILRPEKAGDPEAVRAFIDEADATGAVKQKHVVAMLGHGFADGWHYIVMEFVDGGPLSALLDLKGRIPWREAAKTVIQAARGLKAAHDLGLIHRDVKPENILLYRDGRVRLIDFGIVKDIRTLKGFLLPGTKVGTAAYASPEQCLGKRLGPATDMYSLGATYYHMVCGRPPFPAESPSRTMVKHVKERLVPPSDLVPDLPKSVSKLIERMMAKRQTDRYPSMERLIADLIDLVKGRVPVGSRPDRPPRR